MDPFSQGLFGALWAQAARPGRERARVAALCGGLAGMAPDLDVLIRSGTDSLLAIEYHRHFTHALPFAPVGALVVAVALWPLLRRHTAFASLYVWCLLGYASHGVLDAFTSYGTRLLWPFSDTRFAWHSVSVIDPLFTVPVCVLLVLGLWRKRMPLVAAASIWAWGYLGLGLLQQQRAETQLAAWAQEAGIVVERLVAKPAFASIFLWRGLVETDSHIHLLAIRNLPGTAPRLWPGGSVARFDPDRLPMPSLLHEDLQRFAHFSDGWLFRYPAYDGDADWFVGDFRYAMDPGSKRPLWGVRFDPTRVDEYVRFERITRVDPRERGLYLARLRGEPLLKRDTGERNTGQ